MPSSPKDLPKDPDAILDWPVDWSKWLQAGETISTVAWIVPAGITAGNGSNGAPAPTNTGTAATIWLFGGTEGAKYQITCRITTSAGRKDDRSRTIRLWER